MKYDPKKPYKAIYAGVIAFLGTLGASIADNGVSGPEWVAIALSTALAFGGTYGLSNPQVPVSAPPPPL